MPRCIPPPPQLALTAGGTAAASFACTALGLLAFGSFGSRGQWILSRYLISKQR